jgi:hypothetical protein
MLDGGWCTGAAAGDDSYEAIDGEEVVSLI